MKLGIDFGSTYTTVSKYDWVNDEIVALTAKQGAPASIPSVVAIPSKKGKTLCGTNAKTKIGKNGYSIYQAFKMLLESDDTELLNQKGYDEVNSPAVISKMFLEDAVKSIVNREAPDNPNEPLEEIVICVPEIWVNDMKRLNQRNRLRDMVLKELNIGSHEIQSVHVVTEPEAASAYYAYNFEKNSKTNFNGVFLLIDYGGGTLDLTVTEVESSGRNMEIHFLDNGGTGENHCGEDGKYQIGQAGLAYMQKVVEYAIAESEDVEDKDYDIDSPDFRLAQVTLEQALTDGTNMFEIKNYFTVFGSSYSMYSSILDYDDEVFCQIDYGDIQIDVTYQQLYKAYRDVIEGTLNQELENIKGKVQNHIKIDPTDPAAGLVKNFKIALVGGFCSFHLVRAQIYEFFNLNSVIDLDMRMQYIDTSKAEQAISLGAALIASGRVKQQKTARFSIGLYSQTSVGKHNISYGIVYHQIVEPGKLYYLLKDRTKEDVPSNRCSYAGLKGTIESFVIGYTDELNKGYPLRLKKKMRDRLSEIPEIGVWNCAFSMDEYEVISLHLEPFAAALECKPIEIRLDNYSEMFEKTLVEELQIEDTSQEQP